MSDRSDKQKRDQYEKTGEIISIFCRAGVWYANWTDRDRKQVRRSLKCRSKKEARLRAQKLEAEIEKGDCPHKIEVASVAEAIEAYDDYLVALRRAKRTLRKYRKLFERVIELSTARAVSDMRGIDLAFSDAFRKQRVEEGTAPYTLHCELTVLKQLVLFAVRREMLDKNRLKELKLKRPKHTPQPWWTQPQVELILKTANGSPYHALFSILAWTALRIGEAKHLSWEDVDFEQRVLHIRPKWIGPEKGDTWTPKSGDQRVVPLCDPALALLQSLPRRGRWVFTAPPTPHNPSRDRQIDERRALYHLKKVLEKAGLKGHLHTFRHSLIAHALVNGTPEAIIRKWAGHLDPEILKHYTHIADEDSKSQMVRLFPLAKGPGGNGPGNGTPADRHGNGGGDGHDRDRESNGDGGRGGGDGGGRGGSTEGDRGGGDGGAHGGDGDGGRRDGGGGRGGDGHDGDRCDRHGEQSDGLDEQPDAGEKAS
jgi:integrase